MVPRGGCGVDSLLRRYRIPLRSLPLRGDESMRKGLLLWALGAVALLLAAAPLSAHKIKTKVDYDKSNDFARYKRYSLGKNYLLTHQQPEVQAHMEKILVESLNLHLQAKGFVLDENHPDFTIRYEAGAFPEADVSPQPDMLYGVPLGPEFGLDGLEGIPAAVWVYALGKFRLTVTDVGTGKTVWTALATEKIDVPQKPLHHLRKRVDDLMTRTMKTFPPASQRN